MNVTSNKLFVFSDRKEREECSVSRAQAVKALSPGCLPCILPRSDTSAFAAQVEQRVSSTAAGMLAISLRGSSFGVVSSGARPGSGCDSNVESDAFELRE